jgi:hypothetical protein
MSSQILPVPQNPGIFNRKKINIWQSVRIFETNRLSESIENSNPFGCPNIRTHSAVRIHRKFEANRLAESIRMFKPQTAESSRRNRLCACGSLSKSGILSLVRWYKSRDRCGALSTTLGGYYRYCFDHLPGRRYSVSIGISYSWSYAIRKGYWFLPKWYSTLFLDQLDRTRLSLWRYAAASDEGQGPDLDWLKRLGGAERFFNSSKRG